LEDEATGVSSVGTYLDVEALAACMGHSAGGVPEVGCEAG
jgi:hypothetical protein